VVGLFPADLLMPHLRHIRAGHWTGLPDHLFATKAMERFEQPGHDNVSQVLAFEQGEPGSNLESSAPNQCQDRNPQKVEIPARPLIF